MNHGFKQHAAWLLGSAAVWLWVASAPAGCASNHCLRNTDCPPGYECFQGGCRVPPQSDSGTADAGDGGDAADSSGDADADASDDASDASLDADAASSCDPDEEAGTDAGCVLDASADGSVDAQPSDASGEAGGDASDDASIDAPMDSATTD